MLWIKKRMVLFERLFPCEPYFSQCRQIVLLWDTVRLASITASSKFRKKFPWVALPNRHFPLDILAYSPSMIQPMWYFSKWYCKSSFPSCVDSVEKRLPKIIWQLLFEYSVSFYGPTFIMGGAEFAQCSMHTLVPRPVLLLSNRKLLW